MKMVSRGRLEWRTNLGKLSPLQYFVGYLLIMMLVVGLVLTQFPWTHEFMMEQVPNEWMRFGAFTAIVFFFPIVLIIGVIMMMLLSDQSFVRAGLPSKTRLPAHLSKIYVSMAIGTLIVLLMIIMFW